MESYGIVIVCIFYKSFVPFMFGRQAVLSEGLLQYLFLND